MNIALVGKLGSGKSTIARYLVENHGYERHSWADGVRAVFSMAFDTITPDNYEAIKQARYAVPNADGILVWRTGRELLQRIGTDAMREQVAQDFWLRVGLKALSDVPTVNDDTRFLNEAAALRERGFSIWRVVRPGGELGTHPSEVEQDSIVVDLTIENSGTIEDLRASVVTALDHISPASGGVSPAVAGPGHEIVSEEWGAGDGPLLSLLGDRFVEAGVEYRGVWPPVTRWR